MSTTTTGAGVTSVGGERPSAHKVSLAALTALVFGSLYGVWLLYAAGLVYLLYTTIF